ncbi:hypothetical protein DFH06DRAFT_1366145 [Mycena polygramma]|nr:hypothetical protein DFH06DRAFT_1366145 [Mycena polygramma]
MTAATSSIAAGLQLAMFRSFSLASFRLSPITRLSIPAAFWARPGATTPERLAAYTLSGKTALELLYKRYVLVELQLNDPADRRLFVDIFTSDEFAQRLVKATGVLLGKAPLDVADVAAVRRRAACEACDCPIRVDRRQRIRRDSQFDIRRPGTDLGEPMYDQATL